MFLSSPNSRISGSPAAKAEGLRGTGPAIPIGALKKRQITLGLALLVFPLACLPLSLSVRSGNFADDEARYYFPSVARISAHWPAIDLVGDSTSATSPGYCYFLAGVSRMTGLNIRVFRFITIGLSTAALLLLCMMFRPQRGLTAVWAILPLAASNFFIKSAAWVVTDNVALLLACASLALVLKCPENPKWALPSGLAAAAAIFARQLHAWLVVPIGWAVLRVRGPGEARASIFPRMLALLALVPPIAVLAWLYRAWGGFVPPIWRTVHEAGIHPASVACALSIYAALGVFYALSAESPAGLLRLARSKEAAIGAVAGLLVALISQNAMDRSAGRWGGYFWLLVEHAPSIAGRSVLLVGCSILGGALLGVMVSILRASAGAAPSSIWLVSVLSWLAACSLNPLAFQRYSEPPALMFLIIWLALMNRAQGGTGPISTRCMPLVLLAIVQSVISVFTTYLPVLSAA
jgi:hypothetical protein